MSGPGQVRPPAGRGVLVHEWIARSGGSEKVFAALARLFPAADVLCLWNEAGDFLPGRTIRETGLARTALRGRKMAALPVMPFLWRRQADAGYDWAVISSHLFAHQVRFRGAGGGGARRSGGGGGVRKFVYVHTPARYIWTPELDGRGNQWWAAPVAAPLRRLDRRRAAEPVALAANSAFVRDRIERAWDRSAVVIPPPVQARRIAAEADWAARTSGAEQALLAGLPETFVLGASRLVPYKRLDQVIAFAAANGVPAVIAGAGPDAERLAGIAARASVPVHFLGRVSDELLFELYRRALCFVFPAIEDFGIMPVEAMAAGARVVGPELGGITESVQHGRTGYLCDLASPAQSRAALDAVVGLDRRVAVRRALDFDTEVFDAAVTSWLGADVALPQRIPA